MGLFVEVGMEQDWGAILVQTGLYGYVLFSAANLIGDGAELLLLCPAYASVVGSIVIPILGAVPDGMMVLCSGLGPPAQAQEQVSVGIGALAGSTIMLLTLPWFLAVIAGRVTITPEGKPVYKRPQGADGKWEKLDPKKSWALFGTGVGIGDTIRKNARLMLMTASTYLVIQGAALMVDPGDPLMPENAHNTVKMQAQYESLFAWAGLILSCSWFCFYLYKMASDGGDSDSTIADKIVRSTVAGIQSGTLSLRGAIAEFRDNTWDHLHGNSLDQALLPGSRALASVEQMCKVLVPFYANYDTSKDGLINYNEFQMLVKDLRENLEPAVQRKIFDAADTDHSGDINFEEFVACIISFAMDTDDSNQDDGRDMKRLPTKTLYLPSNKGSEDREEGDHDDGPEEEDMPEDLAGLPAEEQQKRIKQRAFINMAVGTILVLIFSDPMCDMLGTIGDKMGVNKFYVSFVLAPLASNASELVAATKLARKKTLSSMVNSLSSLEGAAIMNNTFCLAIFMLLIVWKGLVWQFTAETVAILVIQVLIGIIAMTQKVETLATAIVILMCYPGSLVIVIVLEAYGWD